MRGSLPLFLFRYYFVFFVVLLAGSFVVFLAGSLVAFLAAAVLFFVAVAFTLFSEAVSLSVSVLLRVVRLCFTRRSTCAVRAGR